EEGRTAAGPPTAGPPITGPPTTGPPTTGEPADAPAAVAPLTRAQKTLAAFGGLLFAGLAGLGGYGSFASVRDVAEPWFGDQAWIVPAGVDLGILALVSVALLLEWLAMPMPALRWMAFAFTGATVWLNVSAAHGDATGMVMHAAMPVLFITFIEAVRHAVRRRAGPRGRPRRPLAPRARLHVPAVAAHGPLADHVLSAGADRRAAPPPGARPADRALRPEVEVQGARGRGVDAVGRRHARRGPRPRHRDHRAEAGPAGTGAGARPAAARGPAAQGGAPAGPARRRHRQRGQGPRHHPCRTRHHRRRAGAPPRHQLPPGPAPPEPPHPARPRVGVPHARVPGVRVTGVRERRLRVPDVLTGQPAACPRGAGTPGRSA